MWTIDFYWKSCLKTDPDETRFSQTELELGGLLISSPGATARSRVADGVL